MSPPLLNRYALRILEVFKESFPEAAHYRGGRKLRKGGWETVFPEIERDVEAKEGFLRAVDTLTGEGVLSVRWKRFSENDRVEALYLEDPRKLYDLAETPFPGDVRKTMLDLLRGARPATPAGRAFRDFAEARLTAYQPLLPGSADPAKDLKDLLVLFDLDPAEAARLPLRALSVRLFGDGKRIEALAKAADTLSRAVTGSSLYEEFGLVRSYPETTVALMGTLVFSDGCEWDGGGRIITLPSPTAGSLTKVRFPCPDPAVLCIENKETFYVYASSADGPAARFDGFLYTGGHLNTAASAAVRLLVSSGAEIYHHGDLDPDGLIIFEEIDSAAGGAEPYGMDVPTYTRYLPYGYPLSENRLKRLDMVTSPKLADLRQAVRIHGKGVEQEVIDPQEIGSG
ncbi:MAG: DUF2399 domain-containing protein [Spirochaetia bacterium]